MRALARAVCRRVIGRTDRGPWQRVSQASTGRTEVEPRSSGGRAEVAPPGVGAVLLREAQRAVEGIRLLRVPGVDGGRDRAERPQASQALEHERPRQAQAPVAGMGAHGLEDAMGVDWVEVDADMRGERAVRRHRHHVEVVAEGGRPEHELAVLGGGVDSAAEGGVEEGGHARAVLVEGGLDPSCGWCSRRAPRGHRRRPGMAATSVHRVHQPSGCSTYAASGQDGPAVLVPVPGDDLDDTPTVGGPGHALLRPLEHLGLEVAPCRIQLEEGVAAALGVHDAHEAAVVVLPAAGDGREVVREDRLLAVEAQAVPAPDVPVPSGRLASWVRTRRSRTAHQSASSLR